MSAPRGRPSDVPSKSPRMPLDRERVGDRDMVGRGGMHGAPGHENGSRQGPPRTPNFNPPGGGRFHRIERDRAPFARPMPLRRDDPHRPHGWNRHEPRRDHDVMRNNIRVARSPRNGGRNPMQSMQMPAEHMHDRGERDWEMAARKSSKRWEEETGEEPGVVPKRPRLKLDNLGHDGGEDHRDEPPLAGDAKGGDGSYFGGRDALRPPRPVAHSPVVAGLKLDYAFAGLHKSASSKESLEEQDVSNVGRRPMLGASRRMGSIDGERAHKSAESKPDFPERVKLGEAAGGETLSRKPSGSHVDHDRSFFADGGKGLGAKGESTAEIPFASGSAVAPFKSVDVESKGKSMGLGSQADEIAGSNLNSTADDSWVKALQKKPDQGSTDVVKERAETPKMSTTPVVKSSEHSENESMKESGKESVKKSKEHPVVEKKKPENSRQGEDKNNQASADGPRRGSTQAEILSEIERTDILLAEVKKEKAELLEEHPKLASETGRAKGPTGAEEKSVVQTAKPKEEVHRVQPSIAERGTISEQTPMDIEDIHERHDDEKDEQDIVNPEKFEDEHANSLFTQGLSAHTEFLRRLIVDVVKTNKKFAAESEQALLHLCRNNPKKLLSAVPHERPEESPSILNALKGLERLQGKLHGHIAENIKKEHLRKKFLRKKYIRMRRGWLDRLHKKEQNLTEEERLKKKEQDQYILMATRGSIIVPSSKTGSRVTYKPAQTGGSYGAPVSLKEVDLMMNEIEQSGGTAGGQERWSKTLACIPNQQPELMPFDGAPYLVENPVESYLSARAANPWTRGERLLFVEKYTSHPKNFRKIASFFENKNVEDVVRFYFQNKMRLNLKQCAKENAKNRRVNNGNRAKNTTSTLSGFPIDSGARRSLADNCLLEDEPRKITKRRRVTPNKLETWTTVETSAFLSNLRSRGVDFEAISKAIGSKSPQACEDYYLSNRLRVGPDAYLPRRA